MTSGEWQKIEGVYLEASDLALSDRAAFLDFVCTGDPVLRMEVENLLNADATGPGFLISPPSLLVADLVRRQTGALAPGTRMGAYEVRSLISVGGMGEVYLAENIHTHQPVALKLIRRNLMADARAVECFTREAQAASALHHANVVAIHEFGTSDAGMFIAMEWVDGQTFRALMDGGRIDLPNAAQWGRQAAGAVAAAHEAGIVHRDLKPENFMLRKDGVVKILDFGLARLTGPVPSDREATGGSGTISGTLSGTLSYMPPELFRGEPATSATDVFSFGSVIYELFTGVHPFAGETPLDVYEAIECREPKPPSSLRAGIPPEVDQLLRRMLDRDREARPEAAAVGAALDAITFGD